MKIRKKVLLFIFFLFGISNVHAAACDNALKVEYQELAKNIIYNYEYIDASNTFDVTLTNVNEIFYIIDMDSNMRFDDTNGEIKINGVIPGSRLRFKVFADDDTPCSSSNIYSIYVSLPYFNPYYNNELCDDIDKFKYCEKFINKSVTYEEFKENIAEYKKSLLEKEKKSNSEKDETLSMIGNIIDFYLKSYFIILPIIIVVGLTIIIIIKTNKKNELF